MHLVAYARNLETLHETPRALPVSFALDRGRVKDLMATILSEGSAVLSEASSKALLDAYEIPVTKPAAGRDRRGRRGGCRADRLPGGAQGPLARRDPQDRRRRRGRGRGHPRRGRGRLRAHRGLGGGAPARRAGARRDRAADGHHPRLRASARGSQGPELRCGDPGRRGGRGRGGARRPDAGPAAPERAPGAPHAGVAADLAAAARSPRDGPAVDLDCPARGDRSLLPSRGRLPGDRGGGDQPAARHARRAPWRWTLAR